MTRRAHIWFLVAIIFLAIATIIGFSQQQSNLHDHEKLDAASCNRALKNREILSDVVETLTHDPGGRTAETQKKLEKLDEELHQLIATAHNCQES